MQKHKMEEPRIKGTLKITFDRLTAAGRALLLCSLAGMTIGVIAGASAGVFVMIVGAIFGAFYGIPIGFASAILGAAIGGRRGWTIGGTICGAIGGLFFAACCGSEPPRSAHALALGAFCAFAIFTVLLGSGVGLVAGLIADDRLRKAPPGGMFHTLVVALQTSRIYDIPLPGRLALAIFELVPLGCLLVYCLLYL